LAGDRHLEVGHSQRREAVRRGHDAADQPAPPTLAGKKPIQATELLLRGLSASRDNLEFLAGLKQNA
jgi:hypothetical protein